MFNDSNTSTSGEAEEAEIRICTNCGRKGHFAKHCDSIPKEEIEKDVADIIQKQEEEQSETSKGLLATIAGPDKKLDVPPKPKEGITFKEIAEKIKSKLKRK